MGWILDGLSDRLLDAFGIGKVFFGFVDKQRDNRKIKVCLYGDHHALYDYHRSEYIAKVQAEKVWEHIDQNFDMIVAEFKGGK